MISLNVQDIIVNNLIQLLQNGKKNLNTMTYMLLSSIWKIKLYIYYYHYNLKVYCSLIKLQVPANVFTKKFIEIIVCILFIKHDIIIFSTKMFLKTFL